MERIDLHYWERVAGGGCAIWEYETRFQTRDANLYDDRMLCTSSNRWLQQKYIMGRAVGKDPMTFTYAYLRACRSQICGSNSKPCSKVFL
ncbi:hypothetical protein ES332_D12G221600v1 [Gossypium tomentosum]|uniref:Uncharacterized protein n=1 Tax=Gossypium tomentosum TaxID=34277 RepID=A0A5D2IE05_GOSTO|nr:hypothetical protein ES332_D12G221600v1 [Gossypium tomentosum]